MNKPLISIIVAIYKVEQYLTKCIESILNQTYENIELILVDDGSPDNSIDICNKYINRDARIVVLSKENGGQATARNTALDIAKGKYIGFVDGDDWIEPQMFEILYKTAAKEQADIVQCGCYIHSDGVKRKDANRHYCLFSSDKAIQELLHVPNTQLNTSVCNKLFRSDIVQNLRFSPVRAYEDDEFIYKSIGKSQSIVCIPEWLYNYYQRANSTMTSPFNSNTEALVTIQKNICDYIYQRMPSEFNACQKTLCSKQFYVMNGLYNHPEIKNSKPRADKLASEIISSYDEYMSNPIMGRNKLMLILIKYTPAFIWKTILNIKFA